MAVPTHFKFTFRGKFLNTSEIWSFGVHFNRNVLAGPDAGLADVNESAVTAAITQLIAGSGFGVFNTYTQVTDWRAYQIGTDGRMEGNPLVVDIEASNIKGAGGNRFPPQIALVVTTVADNRGPARFGRFYLPGPAATLETDFRLSVENTTAYAEKATEFLKDLSGAIDVPGTIQSSAGINVSTRGSVDGTKQEIDHVEVGRVYDTLRTRRNALVEERVIHGQIDW